jgi:membrane-bound ClpP family serine protease
MTILAWIAALLVVGLAMMVLEVFVPSGGVLGFLSVVALVAAVATAFVEQGPGLGMTVLAVACIAVPLALGFAFRLFPETPLGRRVLPAPPQRSDVVPDADRRQVLRGLVGRAGLATSDLVPWGTVRIDGGEHDAVSEGGPITAGAKVEVVGVQAVAVVVRPAAVRPVRPHVDLPADLDTAPPAALPAALRRLEESLEAFDFDALEHGPLGEKPAVTRRLDSPPSPKQA